jgi:RNA polymerase sigma-70 factor (ECF subfamily)
MSTLLEKHIVELLLESNEKAVSLLYDHYSDTLFGIALKIVKDSDLAQDVLQESFVKIWQKGTTYDPAKAKLFTWLLRIVRNTAIDKMRSLGSKTNSEIQMDISDVYNLGSEEIRPEFLDIQQNLDKIDPRYKEVLEALFIQGMTQQEASETLNIPLGTIKSRLKIGLREMKKIYSVGLNFLLILNLGL